MARQWEKLEAATDAFGNLVGPGDMVVWYSGDRARLMHGSVVRLYVRNPESEWHRSERVIVQAADAKEHDCSARCVMAEGV